MKKIERERVEKKERKRKKETPSNFSWTSTWTNKREGDTPLFPHRLSMSAHTLSFVSLSCVPTSTALSPCCVSLFLPGASDCSTLRQSLSIYPLYPLYFFSSTSRCWFAIFARVYSSFFLSLQSGSPQPACQESRRLTTLHRGSILDI